MVNYVGGLPTHIQKQVLNGLNYTKQKTSGDKVATTVEVGAPQNTPSGSPLDGQVAVTPGAPTEQTIVIIVDTSAFDEDDVVTAILGDASEVHEASGDQVTPSNLATVYIGSSTNNRYPVFLNRLCSTPYTFGAFNLKVLKTTGSGASSVVELPETVRFSRRNINGEGSFGNIDVANFENLEAFPRADVKYVDIALSDKSNLFDRDTQWTISNLVGKRKYIFTLYTAFRKDN